MKNKFIIVLLSIGVLGNICTSCKSNKDILYFQDTKEGVQKRITMQVPTIEANDILSVQITAPDPESAIPYNSPFDTGQAIANNIEAMKYKGYLVAENGTISLPVLGSVKVSGMSVIELQSHLMDKLQNEGHLSSPTINVRILNSKVTILGEVRSPGTYSYTEQSITLPQALGYAGDLTINGKRQDVVLLREKDGIQVVHHIDMTKSDWFESPVYFIKQNDIIVVNPNNAKVKSAGYIGNVGTLLSLASVILSAVVIITR